MECDTILHTSSRMTAFRMAGPATVADRTNMFMNEIDWLSSSNMAVHQVPQRKWLHHILMLLLMVNFGNTLKLGFCSSWSLGQPHFWRIATCQNPGVYFRSRPDPSPFAPWAKLCCRGKYGGLAADSAHDSSASSLVHRKVGISINVVPMVYPNIAISSGNNIFG